MQTSHASKPNVNREPILKKTTESSLLRRRKASKKNIDNISVSILSDTPTSPLTP